MAKQSTTRQTELATRSSDGMEVTLLWSQRNGIDEIVVRVSDSREDDYFEVPAQPGDALDVYYHPFAYRDVGPLHGDNNRRAA